MRLYHFTTGGSAGLLKQTGRFYDHTSALQLTGAVQSGVALSDSTNTDAYSPETAWLVVIEIDESRISGYESLRSPTARFLLSLASGGHARREWLVPEEVLCEHARVVAIRQISRRHKHPAARDSDDATVKINDQNALIASIHAMLTDETAALVKCGAATIELDEEWAEVRPTAAGACEVTVTVESDTEVSLVLSPPGDERNPWIDLHDDDAHPLVETVRDHVRAALKGHVEFTFRTGSSAVRLRFFLDGGRTSEHFNNVLLKPLVGRGEGWERFRPPGY